MPASGACGTLRWGSCGSKSWCEEVVDLFKVKGELNPADVMTKPLGRATIDGHLERLLLRRLEGRAASAPAASAEVDTSLAASAPRCLREALDEDRPQWADLCDEWP